MGWLPRARSQHTRLFSLGRGEKRTYNRLFPVPAKQPTSEGDCSPARRIGSHSLQDATRWHEGACCAAVTHSVPETQGAEICNRKLADDTKRCIRRRSATNARPVREGLSYYGTSTVLERGLFRDQQRGSQTNTAVWIDNDRRKHSGNHSRCRKGRKWEWSSYSGPGAKQRVFIARCW